MRCRPELLADVHQPLGREPAEVAGIVLEHAAGRREREAANRLGFEASKVGATAIPRKAGLVPPRLPFPALSRASRPSAAGGRRLDRVGRGPPARDVADQPPLAASGRRQLGEADVRVSTGELLGRVQDARAVGQPGRVAVVPGVEGQPGGRPGIEWVVGALGIGERIGVTAGGGEPGQEEDGKRSPPGGRRPTSNVSCGAWRRAGIGTGDERALRASTTRCSIPGFGHPATEHRNRSVDPRAISATIDPSIRCEESPIRHGPSFASGRPPGMTPAAAVGRGLSNKETAWTLPVHRPIAAGNG